MPDHPAYVRACATPGSDLPHAKPCDAGPLGYRCACGRNAVYESGWCGECAPGSACGKSLGPDREPCPRVTGHPGERLGHRYEPPTNPAAYPHDAGCVR